MGNSISWRFLGVWRRNMRVYQRYWVTNMLTGFLEPLMYLLAMGFGIGAFVQGGVGGVPYVTYIAPGILCSSAMFAASFECTFGTFIRMTFQKTFDAIIATPVSIEEVTLGELLYGASKSVIFGTIILVVIWAMGVAPFRPQALFVLPAALLIGLVFAEMACIVASLVPVIDTMNYYFTLGVTPMFLFSGIFFPVENLPSLVRPVAWLTPLMHAVRLVRGLVLGGTTHLLADTLWLLVAALILLPVPVLLVRRKLIQ